MIDLIGAVGALCFALSALPQAYRCYQQKHAAGFSNWFLGLWAVGEICMIVYSIEYPLPIIILLNYLGNMVCLGIILYYRFWGKNA